MSTAAFAEITVPAPRPLRARTKPALLVAELRGMGDLAILMPFLQAAALRYDVTLLAVPNAAGLLRRFAPDVELIPCVAPWALFSGGWDLPRWPWRRLSQALLHAAQHWQRSLRATALCPCRSWRAGRRHC